ncbi:MAG TPA: alpha/beta fold hydrolase [Steroidobacteraceae bacterium]|nr:alpha/beta fold hydrolase [Steroidobacteraceae bacterium]
MANPRKQIRQQIRYLKASDGARLAWAEAGEGPVIVKASNWLSHLEYEWENPLWKHWLHFFAGNFRFIRYDDRGCGLSEWNGGPLDVARWCEDLEAVMEAARPAGKVTLLGISQGGVACIAYALKHPERVERMILYGAYARGAYLRGTAESQATYRAIIDLARAAWGSDNAAFRQVFTSRFVPEGTAEQIGWFNDLCRRTTTGEIAAALLECRAQLDVVSMLGELRVPTLVIHAREDGVVPVEEGRLLASRIPGAEIVELDSKNHILLESEPAWARFQDAVLHAMRPGRGGSEVFDALSAREREVLALMGDGLANADIAARLAISEKTVRNHASNIFDKLGVWSRAQAIVFARDRGFRA